VQVFTYNYFIRSNRVLRLNELDAHVNDFMASYHEEVASQVLERYKVRRNKALR